MAGNTWVQPGPVFESCIRVVLPPEVLKDLVVGHLRSKGEDGEDLEIGIADICQYIDAWSNDNGRS